MRMILKTAKKQLSDKFLADYKLFSERIFDSGSKTQRDSYGITVTLFECGAAADKNEISDITSERKTAERIFSAILNGGVTPIALLDVVEDML